MRVQGYAPRLDSMKQETADSIFNAQFTDTLRTVSLIERELKHDISEWRQVIFDIADHYADADSIPFSIGYLADSTSADKSFRKMAAMAAIEYDTLGWARSLLDSVAIEDGNDSAFYQFTDLALSLREDSLSWFAMDSMQRTIIQGLAATSFEVKVNAEAVLSLIGDTLFPHIPEPLPDSGYFRMAEQTQPQTQVYQQDKNKFKVYPNPSESSFTLSYSLANKSTIEVTLSDLTGRTLFNKRLTDTEFGELIFDPGSCNGMYILRISDELKQIYNQKLVCLSK